MSASPVTAVGGSARSPADSPLHVEPRPSLWLAASTLWWREIRGFYRQRSRMISAIATPLAFWLFLGAGFGSSIQVAGQPAGTGGYLNYFFPGTVLLIVLFTSIFSNISLIEDRREGFLLSVLGAPVSRTVVVLGKLMGASTLGFLQGLVFLPVAWFVGFQFSAVNWLMVLGSLALMTVGVTSLGFFFAWRLNSTQGFHSVMNMVLMPLWLLSGAVFPVDSAAGWVRALTFANPLSYGVGLFRRGLGADVSGWPVEPLWSAIVALLFAVLAFALSAWEVNRDTPSNAV